jgi:dynein heavy chain
VPTKDTVCYSWFLERYISLLMPVFLTGLTGTGKTSVIANTLSKLKDTNLYSTLEMTFSAKTSSYST